MVGCLSRRSALTDHTGIWEVLWLRLVLTMSLKDLCIGLLCGMLITVGSLIGLVDRCTPTVIPLMWGDAERRVLPELALGCLDFFQLPKCKQKKPFFFLLVSIKSPGSSLENKKQTEAEAAAVSFDGQRGCRWFMAHSSFLAGFWKY